MSKNRWLRWAVIIICVYLIVTTLRSMVDLWRAADKLTRREQALAALMAQQDALLREQNKVNSPDYLEKVAYDQLGLSKPGEEVIVIPKELLKESPMASPDATPNWKKWTRLLF